MATKILYVITKANWGGAQRYVYDLATMAQKQGYEVAVAYGSPGELADRLHTIGITTFDIAGLGRDVHISNDVAAFFSLLRVIRSFKPTVVHLNSSKIGGIGALAGRLARVPKIIFTDHGWAFTEKRPFPVRAVILLFSWLTALLVHRIITVSEYELRITRRMPFCARKAIRIYNGIDLGMQFGSGEVIRAAFPADVTIIGTVGELTKNKNHIALIEQAKNNPTMYVAIVGEGELRTMLKQKIKEYSLESRVKLFGFIPATEVLKGFDVFALPSIKEALGYVILEARAAGLLIDANRVGGVGEALEKPLSNFSLEQMVSQTLALYR